MIFFLYFTLSFTLIDRLNVQKMHKHIIFPFSHIYLGIWHGMRSRKGYISVIANTSILNKQKKRTTTTRRNSALAPKFVPYEVETLECYWFSIYIYIYIYNTRALPFLQLPRYDFFHCWSECPCLLQYWSNCSHSQIGSLSIAMSLISPVWKGWPWCPEVELSCEHVISPAEGLWWNAVAPSSGAVWALIWTIFSTPNGRLSNARTKLDFLYTRHKLNSSLSCKI